MGCCYTTLAHALAATGQAAHRLCLYGIVWEWDWGWMRWLLAGLQIEARVPTPSQSHTILQPGRFAAASPLLSGGLALTLIWLH